MGEPPGQVRPERGQYGVVGVEPLPPERAQIGSGAGLLRVEVEQQDAMPGRRQNDRQIHDDAGTAGAGAGRDRRDHLRGGSGGVQPPFESVAIPARPHADAPSAVPTDCR